MNKNIPSLNGIRAISIFFVIAYHFYMNGYFPNNKVIKYGAMFFCNGPLGVNVFFVISGFIITTLLIQEEARCGKIDIKNFYFRRIIRIFPAYYFLLFFYCVLHIYGYFKINFWDWLSCFTFTKQFFRDGIPETGHLWSLSVEEVFYLIWPILFYKYKNTVKTITISLICVVVLSRLFTHGFPRSFFIDTIFNRGDALLIGCLFALEYTKISACVINWRRFIFVPFSLLVLSIIIYNFLYSFLAVSPDKVFIYFLTSIAYSLFGSIGLLTNFCIGLIIVFSINISNKWFILLNSNIMIHFGKLSYSIYLWQQLFSSDRLTNINFVLLITAIYIISCFSYYIIERPLLKYKSKFA